MPELLLVDDHPIFLDGLKQFLSTDESFSITCAKSADEAFRAISEVDFDLLLLDVSIIGGGGMKILQTVREAGSDIPIIFLTVHITPEDTVEAMRIGINGIILKESAPAEIMQSIRKVLQGETSYDNGVTERALHHSVENPTSSTNALESLTAREREIVNLVSTGLRNREIADECGLTEGTVKTHMHNIFGKIGVRSRTQLLIALGSAASRS